MRRTSLLAVGIAIAAAIAAPRLASGFCLLDLRWAGGVVTMSHNFPATQRLLNGTTTWAANTDFAMNEWSAVTTRFRFVSGGAVTVGQSTSDGINNMVFADNVGGDAFSDEVLAITVTRTDSSGVAVESDIVFNDRVNWDAYEGPIRSGFDGRPLFDIRRVTLHELGHVLGLDHPDAVCNQTVESVMNARTNDTERVTNDDRNGVSFIYADGNQPPQANAGPDQSGDGSEPFLLNGGGSRDPDGFIVSYDWRENGSLVARGRVADIFLRTGFHVVELTVTDDAGAAASDTMNIDVGFIAPVDPNNASPVADAGGDIEVTRGQSVVLDGSASSDSDGSVDRYVWSEGSAILGRESILHVALSPGVHVITLTVFDDKGASDSVDVLVTVVSEIASEVDDGRVVDPTPADTPPDPAPSAPNPCGALGWTLLAAMIGLRMFMRFAST
jgi:PKD domain/Matrixin